MEKVENFSTQTTSPNNVGTQNGDSVANLRVPVSQSGPSPPGQFSAPSLASPAVNGLSPPASSSPTPPTTPSAPGSPPPQQPRQKHKLSGWAKSLGLTLLVLLLLAGAVGLFLAVRQRQNNNSLSSQNADSRYGTLQLPLDDLVQKGALVVTEDNKLTVNGQIQANSGLILAPTPEPTAATKGQIYFDKETNKLTYYNGTKFVALGDPRVESIGGSGGAIGLGNGLSLVNGNLTNTGILSVQGQSGAVTFTGGDGISVDGTTISNSGVSSIGRQSGAVGVGQGLSASGGQLFNSGVLSLSSGSSNLVVSNDGNGNLTITSTGGGTGTVTSSGGTAGRIAKFTSGQNIEDSLLSEAAGTVTANGNLTVAGNLSLGNALTVVNGGTGATTLAANGVLIGNGTSAISSVTTVTSGLCLMSTVGAPTFQACPGGSGGVTSLNGAAGALSIANATESGGVITIDDASTSQKGIAQFNGTNFSVTSGNVTTIQDIDPTANPTFAGINTNSITPSGPLTVGSTSQNLTLQGANTTITETNGANAATLNFVAPTANVTYRLQTAAAGTYDVCTTAGNCTGLGGAVTTPGGTTNQLAKFTGSQTIGDSLISDDGSMVTVSGDLTVTGVTTLTTPLAVSSGGTGATTASSARSNLGAAASGANSDITSITGLTTALSVTQGGTGATSLTANGILLGNGTSAISALAAGSPGQCLVSTVGAPIWQTCPGSGGVTSVNGQTGAVTIANASASGGTVTIDDASTSQKGIASFNSTNFTVSAGAVNTVQNIDPTATPTFAGINTNSVTPMGSPLTLGTPSQNTTLQGANMLITSESAGNTVALSFVAPTANVTYRLQTAAAGTYDVCTTAGNCVGIGGGVTTSGGTTNRLAKFTGGQSIGDSLISDDGSLVTVNGPLRVTGATTLDVPLAVSSGGTGASSAAAARVNLGAASSGANSDITSITGLTTALSVTQGGTGAMSLTANGILLGNGTSPISALAAGGAGQCLVSTLGAPAWQTCPGSGGVTSINGQTGVVTVANASGSGGTVTIDDASTSQKGIAQFNATNFTAAAGVINTAQDINTTAAPTFGRLTVTSSQASNPMVLVNNTNAGATGNLIDLQVNGASRLSVAPSGDLTLVGNINGQTISSAANFTGTLTVAGASTFNNNVSVGGTLTANTLTPTAPLTVGATTQSFTLQGDASSSLTATSAGNTTTLNFQAPTANVTYRLLTASAGTYDICTTVGNCAGVGGGVTTAGGTTNRLAKFTGSQAIGDSIITDDGSTVTVGGTLSVNTIVPSAALTIGDNGQNLVLQGASTSLSASDSGFVNTLTFAVPSGSNKTITIPNASGTVAVSASGPLQLDANGNVSCPLCVTEGGGGGGQGAVDSLNGLTGDLTIANASPSGSTITIDDASTSQKGIAQFNATNFTAAGGVINTAQDINVTAAPTFARLTVTSSQASNPMLLVNNTNGSGTGNLIDLQVSGSSRFAVAPSGDLTLSGTINGQTISNTASFTGSLSVAGAASLNNGATVSGTLTANNITPNSSLTVGATNQSFTLQGNASSTITATSGANTTTLNFQAPTANVTYRLLTASPGNYDICTTVGNCAGVGGGVTTPGGTPNQVAKFTASGVIGDSIISDDGSTVTIAGTLAVNTITPSGAMVIGSTGQNLTLQGAATSLSATDSGITNTLTFATPSGSNKTITIPNASGTVAVSASGPLQLDANGNITCPTCATGSTVSSVDGQTGAVDIANASGSGGTVTIDDASTSQKGIAQFNGVNFSTSGGVVNTIQDINTTAAPTFGRLTVTSSQASNDMLVVNNTNASGTGNLLSLQLNGAQRFSVDNDGNVVVAGTVTSEAINGQTITSAANFTGTMAVAGLASLNGGATVTGTLTANTITSTAAMTVGNTGQNLTLQGAATSISSTSGANTTSLDFQSPTANVTYRLLTAAAGTYDVCTSVGNCVGIGDSITGSGTAGTIAKFTASGEIGDSLLSEAGSTVTVDGDINLTSGNQFQINGAQISSTNLSNDANLAKLDAIQTFTGAANTFQNGSDSTSAFAVQNAAGRNILNVNTTGGSVALGNITSSVGEGVAGTLLFADGTNDNFGLTLNTTTLTASRTITLPDEGGTVCLQNSSNCGFLTGSSSDFIQNQTASDQTANFRISGTGRANTSILTPLLDTASATALNIGTTNATAINLNQATNITGNLVQGSGTFSLTGSSSSFIGTSSGTLALQSQSSSNRIFINGTTTSIDSGSQINLGSSNTSTINVGAQTNNSRTINIGYLSATNAQDVNIGGGTGGSSSIDLQAGTGGINFLTGGAGSKFFFRSTTDSTTAFQIKNNLQFNTVFNADTQNARVGINKDNPSYTLDVFGDINSQLGSYRINGTQGSSITCSGGQAIQNQVVSGGITTGGSCGAVADTLQTAYNNSSSPATITTSAAGKGVSIAAGAVHTTDILSISNAGQGITSAGVEALSINYVGGSAAVESSGLRVDLTPGGTSGGTWSGMRVVANSTGAASGVSEYGIKVEGPSSPGSGTEIGINVTSGWDIGVNISSGGLQLSTQSDPSAPASDTLRVYAKKFANKPILTTRDPGNTVTALQPGLFQKNIVYLAANGGSGEGRIVGLGDETEIHANYGLTFDQTLGWTLEMWTDASANDFAGAGEGYQKWIRGNAAGANGFFVKTRVGFPDGSYTTSGGNTGSRIFVGLANANSGGGSSWFSTDNPSSSGNGDHRAGFSFVSNGNGRQDTNWQFTTRNGNGGSQTLQNTSMAFEVNKMYDMYIYCSPQCSTIYWRIENLTDNTSQEGSQSSTLPGATTKMQGGFIVHTINAATRTIRFQHMYMESDK